MKYGKVLNFPPKFHAPQTETVNLGAKWKDAAKIASGFFDRNEIDFCIFLCESKDLQNVFSILCQADSRWFVKRFYRSSQYLRFGYLKYISHHVLVITHTMFRQDRKGYEALAERSKIAVFSEKKDPKIPQAIFKAVSVSGKVSK